MYHIYNKKIMKWVEEDVKLAIERIKNGNTYLEIGLELNRSQDSVRNKLNEFGLKFTQFNLKEKKYCLNCEKELIDKRNTFCNHSCSATHINKFRTISKKINKCLSCSSEINHPYTYCNNTCAANYNLKIKFEKIESGDTTLYFKIYKKYLIEKYGDKCMECGWCEVNNITGNIPIQLEHIDGNSDNNSLDNLKLLCPNCHSLTSTFGNLNRGDGRDSKRKKYRKNWRLNNVDDT